MVVSQFTETLHLDNRERWQKWSNAIMPEIQTELACKVTLRLVSGEPVDDETLLDAFASEASRMNQIVCSYAITGEPHTVYRVYMVDES